jgi:hypothetical protein
MVEKPALVYANLARVRQVFRWLKVAWPPPINPATDSRMKVGLRTPISLPALYKDCSGITVWNDAGGATIWVRHTTIAESIDVLIHEWAHILTEGRGEHSGHGHEFYITYGDLERSFHYLGGTEHSRTL